MPDLWDPAFKGKVGMMSDSQEIGNFGMFALGIDPEKSTPDDWKKAGAKLQGAEGQGHRPQVLRAGLHRRPDPRRRVDHHGLVR